MVKMTNKGAELLGNLAESAMLSLWSSSSRLGPGEYLQLAMRHMTEAERESIRNLRSEDLADPRYPYRWSPERENSPELDKYKPKPTEIDRFKANIERQWACMHA